MPPAFSTPQSPPASAGPLFDRKGKGREIARPDPLRTVEEEAEEDESWGSLAPAPYSAAVPAPVAVPDMPRATAAQEGPLSTVPETRIRFGEPFLDRAIARGFKVDREGESPRVFLPTSGEIRVGKDRLIIIGKTQPSTIDSEHDVVVHPDVDMREVFLLLKMATPPDAFQGLSVYVVPGYRGDNLPTLLGFLQERGALIVRAAEPTGAHTSGAADSSHAVPSQSQTVASPPAKDLAVAPALPPAAPPPQDDSDASTPRDQGPETEPKVDRERASTPPRSVHDDSVAPSQSEAGQESSGYRIDEIPGQATPAGWHYPAGGSLREAEELEFSERLRPTPEYFKATAHGLGERVLVEGRYLNASEFADLIRNTPDWRRRPLIFVSQGIGDISTQFAERVSRLLGVPVVVASGGSPVTWILIDGDDRRELSADEVAALGL
jgi:hypothetical protein